MPSYPFMQIDAFTHRPLGGNPCAVIFDADAIEPTNMLAIAREMNLSETVFVLKSRSDSAHIMARYFTPAEEIPFAGHPTIATAFALMASQRLPQTLDTIRIELRAGIIPVDIVRRAGQADSFTMTQPTPQFLTIHDAAEVLPVFGLTPDDVIPGMPIQTVSTGLPQLMIPLRSLEAVRRAHLDMHAYNTLRARGSFFSAHLFCMQGITPQGDTFARHFVSPPDLLEDPYTGSATGAMGAYIWQYGLLERPNFRAEQGHDMGRPGQGTVEVIGPRNAITAVKVGGSAAVVIEGELKL